MLDEVKEVLLAPLDVVEDDNERPFHRGVLERLAECPGDLLRGRHHLRLAEQRADRDTSDPLRRRHVELLEYLDNRPVGDPLAVGQAAAADDGRLDRSQSLSDQPGLSDPGVSDHRYQLAALLGLYTPPRPPDDRELTLTADEPRFGAALWCLPHTEEPVGGNRPGLAFQLKRLQTFDLDRVADESERRCSNQHLARRRGLLQPRGHVDRVTGRETFLGPGYDLAAGQPDPGLEAEPRQRVSHFCRSPNGAQRVVLVEHWYPEHGHHRIADELLHRPAVALDDRLHPLEVTRQQPTKRLGIERLPKRSRAGHVTEQDRDRLAELPRLYRLDPLCAAVGTEAEVAHHLMLSFF